MVPLERITALVLAAGHAEFTIAQRERFHALCDALTPVDWATAFDVAGIHSMRSLLWYHLAREHLESRVDARVWEIERGFYQRQLLALMRMRTVLGEVLSLCTTTGIRILPRKGPALSMRIYGALGPRPSRDLDFLVGDEVSQRRMYRLLQPYFAKWEARGIRVELAWSLIHRLSYRAAFDPHDIWQRAMITEFRGMTWYLLHPYDELRYLCAHHMIHHDGMEWLWAVDISELVRSHVGDTCWNWQTFVQECVATQTALPIARALVQARTLFDAPVPDDVVAALEDAAQSPAEQTRWEAAHIPHGSFNGITSLLRSAKSAKERWQLLHTLIWPDRTYLREYHDWTPGQHVTSARFHRLHQILAHTITRARG